jgi:hypothetical protein
MSYLLVINFEKKSIKMLTNSADLLKALAPSQMSFLKTIFRRFCPTVSSSLQKPRSYGYQRR